MSVEQEGLLGQCNVCLWVPALPVGMYCPKIQTQEKKSVESVYVCGEYRELCCRNIVGVEREVLLIVVLVMSIQPVRLAIREGTGDLKTPFLCECTA